MSSEAPTAGHPGLHPGGIEESFGGIIDKQLHRAHTVKSMIGSVGLANTGRLMYQRLVRGRGEHSIEIGNQPKLRYPLHLTTTPSDVNNYCEVFQEGAYDLPEQLDDTLDGLPIVDMGAFIGVAAAYFASRYPDSRVLAIEPHPRNYELLEANAQPYGGQVAPIFGAISTTRGIAVGANFKDVTHDYMGNIFSTGGPDDPDTFSHEESVAARAEAVLPEDIAGRLGDRPIGLLKVDIEGAERALFLADGINELLTRTRVLVVETHDQWVPGSSLAVQAAATRHGMVESQLNRHGTMYVNPQAAEALA